MPHFAKDRWRNVVRENCRALRVTLVQYAARSLEVTTLLAPGAEDTSPRVLKTQPSSPQITDVNMPQQQKSRDEGHYLVLIKKFLLVSLDKYDFGP